MNTAQEYVIDASALIQAFVIDTHTSRMQTVIQMLYDTPPLNLHFLDFGLAECLNIFWKRISFHNLPEADAQIGVQNIAQLPLTVHANLAYQKRALEIGVAHHLPMYDALYLALAENLQLPIITDDVKQAKIAQSIGLIYKPITDFPEYVP